MKKILIILIITSLVFLSVFPDEILAAGDVADVTSFTRTPSSFTSDGGTATFTFTVTNNSNDNMEHISLSVGTGIIDYFSRKTCDLNKNQSKTFTFTATIPPSAMDKDLAIIVKSFYPIDGFWRTIYTSSVRFTTKADVPDDKVYTTVSAEPEKEIYYVGETVNINTHLVNRTSETLSNVKLQFYKIKGGAYTYDTDIHSLSSFSGNEQKDFTYTYTFTEDDVGTISIASVINFTCAGQQCEESNAKYDFTVQMPAATPTASPTATPAPAAEVTPTPLAATATVQPKSEATEIPTLEPANADSNGGSAESQVDTEKSISERADELLVTPAAKLIIMAVVIGFIIVLTMYLSVLRKYRILKNSIYKE